MVKIDFIKTEVCPVCGCQTVISESVETEFGGVNVRHHSNGAKWEYREFACGYKVHFCPNFMKEEVLRKCHFDPDEAEKRERQKIVKQLVYQQIESGECDDAYKSALKRAIEYI